jgi:hypothetical protein
MPATGIGLNRTDVACVVFSIVASAYRIAHIVPFSISFRPTRGRCQAGSLPLILQPLIERRVDRPHAATVAGRHQAGAFPLDLL